MPTRFETEQVKALCRGEFPTRSGFEWSRVDYFLLEDGLLQPYAGDHILPGPAITVVAAEMPS